VTQMQSAAPGSISTLERRQRKIKLALLVTSLFVSAAVFLILDWVRSATIRRNPTLAGNQLSCRVRDPVRDHALKPNCSSIMRWGRDAYEFHTNSLGFRDERIREVPLVDARPRILMLGDSFTEGKLAWRDSYVARVAAHFPQYDFLNGGVSSYSPSNYLNVARMVLAKGVDIDEVIVFIDISDVQDEAAFYRDVDASGAVTAPEKSSSLSAYARWRHRVAKYLMLTNYIVDLFERSLVDHGYYHLTSGTPGNVFDRERSAWTYRKVNETSKAVEVGYGPAGVEGGIAREKAKMTLLWQDLERRSIPISVVVYPWPAQVVHDSADSRQVRIWRDWCGGKCKRFISLFPAFFAAKAECPRTQPGCWYLKLFIFGDSHYNAAGNGLVADAVIRSLSEAPPTKRP